MANFLFMWPKIFPPKNSVSKTTSPCTIVTGMSLNYRKYCKYKFWSYGQTHEKTSNNTNDMFKINAIFLEFTRNLQRTYKFLSLDTGKPIYQKMFNDLPMPEEVITRGEYLATN